MWELTRRRFLTRASVGVGIAMAGAVATLPNVGNAANAQVVVLPPTTPEAPMPAADLGTSGTGLSMAGPVLVHVRDIATAEVAVMFGTQEFVYRDPQLVARIVQAAGNTRAEG